MISSSLLTPCLTFITALLFQQIFGDKITQILILCYWLLLMYIIWLLSMYIPIGSIMIYTFPQYFGTTSNFYVKINFYLKLISDICLLIVTVSDFIYSNLMTINWSKMHNNDDQNK